MRTNGWNYLILMLYGWAFNIHESKLKCVPLLFKFSFIGKLFELMS